MLARCFAEPPRKSTKQEFDFNLEVKSGHHAKAYLLRVSLFLCKVGVDICGVGIWYHGIRAVRSLFVVYQILDVLLETGFIGDPGTGRWRSHLREDLFMVFSFLRRRIQLKTSMELYRADFR